MVSHRDLHFHSGESHQLMLIGFIKIPCGQLLQFCHASPGELAITDSWVRPQKFRMSWEKPQIYTSDKLPDMLKPGVWGPHTQVCKQHLPLHGVQGINSSGQLLSETSSKQLNSERQSPEGAWTAGPKASPWVTLKACLCRVQHWAPAVTLGRCDVACVPTTEQVGEIRDGIARI